jgi:hypothetical protein
LSSRPVAAADPFSAAGAALNSNRGCDIWEYHRCITEMDSRSVRGVACCPWNAGWVCCWSGENRDVRLYESMNGKLLLRAMLPEIVSPIRIFPQDFS